MKGLVRRAPKQFVTRGADPPNPPFVDTTTVTTLSVDTGPAQVTVSRRERKHRHHRRRHHRR